MDPKVVQCAVNPVCYGGAVIQGVAGKAASDGFQRAADSMFQGYDNMMKEFVTSWINAKFLVGLDNSATEWFHQSSLTITIALLTLGLMVAGIRIMYTQRGEPFREAMQTLGRSLAIITFGTAAIQVFIWGSDEFSSWILKASGTELSNGYVASGFATTYPALGLCLGLLGILAVGIQWVIMFVRQAILILLNAFWQLTAAYATLKSGQQAFEKVTAWIIAFILYTPLAASIYAFAWRLKDGADGIGGVLYGVALIGLAIVALPAMMRLLIPATSAMGNAIGGAMALGVGAAVVSAGVAVGAAVATGGTSAAAGAGAGAGMDAAAGGGEMASAAGDAGGAGSSASGVAGGGTDGSTDGAGDMVGGDSGSGTDSAGPPAGGASDSGSGTGQSAGSRGDGQQQGPPRIAQRTTEARRKE
ncbi:hypothetical protein MAFF212519_02140 [Clavibacter michiganensis]